MKHVRFCILGAGPSGLAFAAALKRAGCDSFVLLEKEPDAGGLCRSAVVDGAPLDIGGGHFLDIARQRVLNFVFAFMPREEWREFKRVSTIRIRGLEVEHPLEGNLWQLPLDAQVEFLESIARAGVAQGIRQTRGGGHHLGVGRRPRNHGSRALGHVGTYELGRSRGFGARRRGEESCPIG